MKEIEQALHEEQRVEDHYFHYMSQEKLETLLALSSRESFKLTSITPTGVIGPNRSLMRGEERQPGYLVSLGEDVIASVNAGVRAAPPDRGEFLEVTKFYHDLSAWRSGVFSFDSSCEQPTLVYVAWRAVRNSLVLLVGSPNNIVGAKKVEGDCFIPGTQGAHLRILDFVDQTLGTDERVMVSVFEPELFGDTSVAVPELTNGEVISRLHPKAMAARWHDITKGDLSLPASSDEKGLRLGFLCLKNMLRLPQTRIEVIFRVFGEYSIPKAREVDRFGTYKPVDKIAEAKNIQLLNYDKIYLCSPVFVSHS